MTSAAKPHQPGSREPITHKSLLVVEGRDTYRFVLALLRHLQLDSLVEVRDGGGISQLAPYLRLLTAVSGYENLVAMGIIRDCEQDPARALQSVQNALTNAGLRCPAAAKQFAAGSPETGIFLLPDAATPGMLETLCWRAVSGQPIIPCVDDFLRCAEQKSGHPLAAKEKSRVYAYIAAQEKPESLLGQAAHVGYFPWDSAAFGDLKEFVRELAKKGTP